MTLRVGRAQFRQRSTYSFYARRSQKRKKDSQVVNLFTILGYMSAKAACKMLVKLTPGLSLPYSLSPFHPLSVFLSSIYLRLSLTLFSQFVSLFLFFSISLFILTRLLF